MPRRGLSYYFLPLIIAAAFVLAFQILMPFIVPIALSAAFGVILWPMHARILHAMEGHRDLAAAATLLVTAFGVLAPLGVIFALVGWEAAKLYVSVSDGTLTNTISMFLRNIVHALPADLLGQSYIDSLAGDLSTYAREALVWLSSHVTDAFSSIASILLNLMIFFVALFFFLRDGEEMKEFLVDLSPLSKKEDEMIFERLARAVNSVIRGNLLIALIRGIASAVGFFFFGIPNPLLWGIMAGILGLIPSIGVVLVFAPAILYAYFTHGLFATGGLFFWGVMIVGLVDNVLAPPLMGRATQVHPLLVFLSIFGGITYFGPAGIFLGPLSLSFLFVLLSVYASPQKTEVSE